MALIAWASAFSAEAQPKKKDSSPRLVPKEVSFATEITPKQARPGETVTLQVTARVAEPWHIYAYSPSQPKEGPRSTQFDLFDPAGLEPVGDWTPSQEPQRKPEPAFDNKVFAFHEGEITWSRQLRVPATATPGEKTVKVQAYFQICDPKRCQSAVYLTLPPATVTIEGAAAAAPAATPREPALVETTGTGPRREAKSEIEGVIARGLIPFLLFSAGGGLLALLMPCVWPMVPVTVNFFVKQGQAGRGRTISLAVTYCLAIIGVFTLVGVLFSALLGASSLQRLANTAWLNLTVAAIFIVFGLSLLGLFELRLPSWLLNASAQNEARGGLIGVVFMALTLTITSFTCTFPVVGGLLVVASRGSYLYPVLGLATFATVLALPFFLLALAPGLLRSVPRSGDWMNAVKVVGGLVEIGAAFKFLNTAEIALGATPQNAWFDTEFVLAVWVVMAAVCGLYLLGLFRTDHDHEAIRVGPVRMLLGASMLFLALYLAPALFGTPPKSRMYNRLVVGLLPADSHELEQRPVLPSAVGEGPPRFLAKQATSADPEKAEAEERSFHGVVWGFSYNAAVQQAKAEGKPILIDFTGVNCANCRQMEREVLPQPEIAVLLQRFVTVQLYTDFVPIDSITQEQREELARANAERQVDLVNDTTTPLYVVLTPDGEVIGTKGGYVPVPEFKSFLITALERGQAMQVASAR
jgi:thiol:disulfide interchange protein DsbD